MKRKQSLKLLVAIVAVVGFAVAARLLAPSSPASLIDPLGNTFSPLPEGLLSTGAGLGVLLLGAWLLGKAAQAVGFSKITGYLVFGIIASPKVGEAVLGSGMPWILSEGQRDNLTLVNELAIALIALTAGGEIRLDFLKKAFKSISLILLFEFTLVLIAITALMSVLLEQTGVFAEYGGLATVVLVSAVIGIVATANSPAVVIAILGETRSDGPMSRTALSVTVCKDLLLIVVFAVALAVATNAASTAKAKVLAERGPQPAAQVEGVDTAEAGAVKGASERAARDVNGMAAGGADAGAAGVADEGQDDGAPGPTADAADAAGKGGRAAGGSVLTKLTKQLGGSMVAGLLIGMGLAWYIRTVNAALPIVLVLGSFGVALLSKELGLKTLIVGLSAGLTMANVYRQQAHGLFERVEELSVPVYAVFFAVAGAKVDPSLLAGLWVFVVLYVLLRGAAVWAGTGLGCKLAGVEAPGSRWVWTAFVPQAGISLALAVVVEEQFAAFAFSEKVFGILLSSIAINELLGPILFKFGLGRAGEAGGATPGSGGAAGAHE
jgi:Kef-type K+ transport system membrane component KefB